MISVPRSIHDKGFFHVMVQGLNKEYIFNKQYYKNEYIRLINKYNNKYNILLLAYCIMDNHAHLLIYTEKSINLSMFMQNINSKFALYYNKDIARVGYVFRGRFNSQYIDNTDYLLRCLNYIHMNPVKANIVKEPKDYKYSTYNDYLENMGILNDAVLAKVFGTEKNYLDKFLTISDEEFEVMDIDREDKNLEIAIKKFLEENRETLDSIKKEKDKLNELCVELILNKGYKQVKVVQALKISKSTVSKYVSDFKKQKKWRNRSEQNFPERKVSLQLRALNDKIEKENGENAPSKKFLRKIESRGENASSEKFRCN